MKKIDTITFTAQSTFALNLVMLLLLFTYGALYGGVIGVDSEPASIPFLELIVFFATGIVHELLHGLGFMLAGVKPTFGAGITNLMPYAYATSKQKLPLKQMLVTAYLPAVVLSILFIALGLAFPEHHILFLAGFLANLTGAVGDFWIASKLWKYLRFKDVMILDTKLGTEVYTSDKRAVELASKSIKKRGK